MIEFTVQSAAKEPGSVFVLSCKQVLSAERAALVRATWGKVWADAGHEAAPGLLLLDGGTTLAALSDDHLRQHGLLRA